MYNISMLRHRFSNDREGGGGEVYLMCHMSNFIAAGVKVLELKWDEHAPHGM